VLESRRAHFVDLHVGDTPGQSTLEIIVPLFATTGLEAPPTGYALFQIDPALYLFPLLQLWPTPSATAETMLVRREGGDVVYLNTPRHRSATPLSQRIPLDTPNLIAARGLLDGQEVVDGTDYRGEAALGVALRVPATDWLLIAKMDTREVYADVRRTLAWIFAMFALLLGILLAWGRAFIARQHAEAHAELLERDKARLEALHRVEESLAENERRLRRLGDNLPDSYVYRYINVPEDVPRFLYLSGGVERVHGLPAEAALQNPVLLFRQTDPQDVPGNMAAENLSRERMTDYEREFRVCRADGQLRWLHVRSHPVQQADGQIVWEGIATDVTAKKQDEERLVLASRRAAVLLQLPALAEQLDEMAFMQQGQEFAEDLTGSTISFIHFVNADEQSIELVTWSKRTLAHYCQAAFDRHYPVAQAGIWADALRLRQPVLFNDYANTPNRRGLPEGHADLLRLISVPVMEQGKVVMLTGVGNKTSDYTEDDIETVQLISNAIWRIVQRKRMEGAMREALEAQRALNLKLEEAHNQLLQSEKMASIGQLAAGVAHEINNPIGFVSSNISTLEGYLRDLFQISDAYAAAEGSPSACCPEFERARALKMEKDYDFLRADIPQLLIETREGLSRVATIVRDLKDFSRPGDAAMEWADLHQGLDSTLNIVWNELKYKCTVKKEYGELPPVWCVLAQLNQVFMNLLVNAAHAIPEKGDITIRTGQQGAEVFVAIADTGSGIAAENLTRIFDPFFTTKPVGSGTGLGLSLAYSIVRKHQGRIEVQSEAGKGTVFTVWLPIKPVIAGSAENIMPPAPIS
jgi:PAS domain S-box-containing protein